MAKFGTFKFAEDLYGLGSAAPVVNLLAGNVSIIHPRLIQFNLNTDVVVNDAFFDASNYTIEIYGTSSTDAIATRVLVPYVENSAEASLVTRKICVVTQELTVGTRYSFSLSNLTSTDGSSFSTEPSHRLARRTKSQSAIKALAPHYNIEFGSNVAGILTAIGMSDDLIGGNQNELV